MRIAVNPIACEGHGLCAELLPESITLDDWGYPVIAAGELPPSLERLARRAVGACPTLALRLEGRAARGSAPRSVGPRRELTQQHKRKH
jgi:ferredoxin